MRVPAVLGIDPGVTGAMALVGFDGKLLDTADIPNDGNGRITTPLCVAILRNWSINYEMMAAAVENVGSMPGQGVSTTFKFGRAAGVCETLPLVHALPVHLVTPSTWKKHHKLTGQDKDAARQLAIRLWPEMAETTFKNKGTGQARADAALIALYWLQEEASKLPGKWNGPAGAGVPVLQMPEHPMTESEALQPPVKRRKMIRRYQASTTA